MKVKYFSTTCLSLLLIFSTVFSVATAADAQEVHALLIILGNDKEIRDGVEKNEDLVVKMLKQLSDDCTVKLTVMKSKNGYQGEISRITYINQNSRERKTTQQDIIESRQVAEWLVNLKPKSEDTVLIYYSSWQETFEKTKAQTKELYRQAEFDGKIAADLRKNRQTTQTPTAYHEFPTRIDGGGSVLSEYSDMVLIPAGEFQMGSNNGYDDEKPVHTVYVDAFYMDKYEVTNAAYKQFIDANPQWRKDRIADRFHDGDYLKYWNGNNYPGGKANYPVVFVRMLMIPPLSVDIRQTGMVYMIWRGMCGNGVWTRGIKIFITNHRHGIPSLVEALRL